MIYTSNEQYEHLIVSLFHISVAPGKDDIDILGLPDAVESGTNVELTCIVQRIKPQASDMYWILNGRRLSFTDIEAKRNKDKTHKQFIKLNYRQDKWFLLFIYVLVETISLL